MISAVKNVLGDTLAGVGIPREKIARDAREEQTLTTRREGLPFASLITDPGRFEAADHREVKLRVDGGAVYKQVRTKRVMSVVVKIIGRDEAQVGPLVSKFIAHLPFFWEYEGIRGLIEPTHEEYSDYEGRMNARYEGAVLVEFSMDVGSKGTGSKPVEDVNEGDGKYEKR